MSDEGINRELWEFPCNIAFKSMATNRTNIEEDIISAIQNVVPGDYSPDSRPSKNGNYLSVTVSIRFENAEQVEAVYRDVRAINDVKICL